MIFSSVSFGQEWTTKVPPNASFSDVKKAFYDYWETKSKFPVAPGFQNNVDGELQQFQRLENFMKFRSPGNKKIDPTILWSEWEKFKQNKNTPKQKKATSGWSPLGPFEVPGNGGGMGRINTIEFNPSNPDIFWVGSACGGLWKTSDGGNSWSSTSDFLPAIGISDIAIDPINPNNMYIATGDGYGYENGVDFWGGTYTAGVLKSTDGGITWNSTGLTYNQNQGRIIQRLVINPLDPQVLLAASRDGMWRTSDAGINWTKVSTVHFYDIEFNTADANIVYAAAGNHFFKSVNKGLNWSVISAGLCGGGRQSIAVTQTNPNVIYSLCESGGLFISSDGGISFSQQTAPSVTFYGYYDNVLAVSPTDENKIFVGGLELGMSSDGGGTWSVIDDWSGWPNPKYCHADKHDIEFPPGNGNVVFICTDGGVFKSTDGGNSYTNLSSGISISQFYRLGGSELDKNIVYCGQQDNGVVKKDNGNWDMVVFADGMECAVNYSNSDNVLAATQYGQLNITTDGGLSWTDVSPSTSGSWTTPFLFHPTDPSILFAGYEQLYKSSDGGWSWTSIGNPTNNATIDVLVISPSDPNYIYVGTTSDLYKSTDGGTNWQSISSSFPLVNNSLSGVAVSGDDPQKIWATLSGYSQGSKVYCSKDGGASWINCSGTLPNIPVNCILIQNNSPEVIYLGTDFGVFYRDSTMTDWLPFNDLLPNVIVNELEIHYGSGKLRAATYGRGLWETDLEFLPVSNKSLAGNSKEIKANVYPNPTNGKFFVSVENPLSSQTKITVFGLTGSVLFDKTLRASESSFTLPINLSGIPSGLLLVEILTNDKRIIKKVSLTKEGF